ncbi:VOC family protein [Chryseobacterium pennae]|uniref:VOC family protein n=1 Tax=Chryseobacterium pennae TaxID=2258962 RepID=A0A3D9C450_9FLAO|nr:VOC family protein [Chryseobacterium pennae]REC60519.1 VOC family protein [Chryseobacterium pennae]
MKKVTGIGGIFFKCKDPKVLKEWYKKHLGIDINEYGATFNWKDAADANPKGSLTWSPSPETTNYFEPSAREFMINYTVDDLEALVEQLRKEGVTILDDIETYDFGKFIHILDIEENKVELWEPK